METRVALMGIIVEEPERAAEVNELLHRYSEYVIGRMGVPYRARGVSIISAVRDAPQDVISALYGDKILRLNPYRYNMTERLFTAAKLSPRAEMDLNWVWENSRIIHYCGRNKPWKESYLGQLGRFYQLYAQMTKPI